MCLATSLPERYPCADASSLVILVARLAHVLRADRHAATRDEVSPVPSVFLLLLRFPRYANGCGALRVSVSVRSIWVVLALGPLLILVGHLFREGIESMAAQEVISSA